MLIGGGFFNQIGNTWSLIGTSWNVVKKDKEMLIFPLISGICLLLVLGSFGMGFLDTEAQNWAPPEKEAPTADHVAYYGKLFIFYFCTYFIIMFFNTGIIAAPTPKIPTAAVVIMPLFVPSDPARAGNRATFSIAGVTDTCWAAAKLVEVNFP